MPDSQDSQDSLRESCEQRGTLAKTSPTACGEVLPFPVFPVFVVTRWQTQFSVPSWLLGNHNKSSRQSLFSKRWG